MFGDLGVCCRCRMPCATFSGWRYNHKPIAWDDSYPDGGRWATTIWEPEQLIVDRWRIWMSGRTLARLTVDVYRLDRENGAP